MHGMKFNLIILGDGAVGKTSLLSMYKTGTMNMTHVKTIGIDHVTTNFTVDGHTFTVKIWDTAGQEKFGGLPRRVPVSVTEAGRRAYMTL